jgi:hypothetical protein
MNYTWFGVIFCNTIILFWINLFTTKQNDSEQKNHATNTKLLL